MNLDLAAILVFCAPVAIAALGEVVNERAGSINIGLEGMMLMGSFAALWASLATGSPALALGTGLLVGTVAALVQGWFTIKLSRDQVVVGTAINLMAIGLTGTLYRAWYGQSGQLLSLPGLGRWQGLDVVLVLLLVLVPLVWWILERTALGLAIRASGHAPQAVRASGHSVLRLRALAGGFGGAMAGLAGAYLAVGVAGSFAEKMTQGRGFVALALVTFGRWNPFGALAAACLVGYAESLQYTLQSKGGGIPHQFLVALPYVLALLVLVVVGRGGTAPASLGKPYVQENP